MPGRRRTASRACSRLIGRARPGRLPPAQRDRSFVQRSGYFCRSAPEVVDLLELVEHRLVRVDGRVGEDRRVDVLLGRLVGAHVVDEVRVRRADLGVEHVVDEQVGGDRVRGVRQQHHRVRAADAALGREHVLDRRPSPRSPGATSPLHACMTQTSPLVRSPMSSVVYVRRSGFCSSSSASACVELGVARRVDVVAEPDERGRERLAVVVEHRHLALPPRVPERGPRGQVVRDLRGVVARRRWSTTCTAPSGRCRGRRRGSATRRPG